MKENSEIKKIFKLYLEGNTNPQEEEKLYRYLADEQNKDGELLDLMEEAWQNEPILRSDSPEEVPGLERIWKALERKKQKKVQHLQMYRYAASFILFMFTFWGWHAYNNRPLPQNPFTLVSKTTQIGEKIKILLPDSSVVYLSGGSKLVWPSHFREGTPRNIRLEGEAFFEVKRDTASPFIIKSGHLQTKVLGTSFNVYAYPSDQAFSVAVRTGKVSVSESIGGKFHELIQLSPGMKLVYDTNNRTYAVSRERVDEISSWITNKFVFRNKNLAEMLAQIERYYDVHFELKNSELAGCQFNATFSDKSINDVMEQIRIMSGNHIQYTINKKDKKIALWGEGCQ